MAELRARIGLIMEGSNRRIEGDPANLSVKPDGTWLTLDNCATKNPSSGIRNQTVRLESVESLEMLKPEDAQ